MAPRVILVLINQFTLVNRDEDFFINKYMNKKPLLIIDFDSTFIKLEGLDELAKIVFKNHSDKEKIERRIKQITKHGMEGKISFEQSLQQRLEFLKLNKKHIKKLIKVLNKNITPSVLKNQDYFKKNANRLYIVSGGFKEWIVPVVKKFGISPKHVFGNQFIFNKTGRAIGYQEDNLLSKANGKARQVQQLKLKGQVHVIGDGYTDYQIVKAGAAHKYFAFIENIQRKEITKHADIVLSTFDNLFIYF